MTGPRDAEEPPARIRDREEHYDPAEQLAQLPSPAIEQVIAELLDAGGETFTPFTLPRYGYTHVRVADAGAALDVCRTHNLHPSERSSRYAAELVDGTTRQGRQRPRHIVMLHVQEWPSLAWHESLAATLLRWESRGLPEYLSERVDKRHRRATGLPERLRGLLEGSDDQRRQTWLTLAWGAHAHFALGSFGQRSTVTSTVTRTLAALLDDACEPGVFEPRASLDQWGGSAARSALAHLDLLETARALEGTAPVRQIGLLAGVVRGLTRGRG